MISSSTIRVRIGWTLAILLLAIAGPAWADDPKQEAKARYTTGQSHYNLNEFQEALQDFKEAYRLFPDPVFLFNVAQCERQLGNQDEAIKFYRSYLRNKPKAPNRQEVERRIDEMQAAIDAKKVAAEKPSLALVPPAPGDESHVSAPVPPATATPQNVAAPLPTPAPAVAPETAPTAPAPLPAALSPAPTPPLSVLPATFEPAASGHTQTENSGPHTDLLAQTSIPAPAASPAFYQRWWFWTGAAVVLAGVGVGVYAIMSRGGNGAPSAKLGTQAVF
jgi:tetratricopeptide (TPR) repeat protein